MHDVIAAMATEPELSSTRLAVDLDADRRIVAPIRRDAGSRRVATGASAASAAPAEVNAVGSDAGNDSADASWTLSPFTGVSSVYGPSQAVRECAVEVRAQVLETDAVLRAPRPGDGRLDAKPDRA